MSSVVCPYAKPGDPSYPGHHYVLESPNGPESTAACRLCGKTTAFTNYGPSERWNYEQGARCPSGHKLRNSQDPSTCSACQRGRKPGTNVRKVEANS